MHILIIGKGATDEVCAYLQHPSFEWSEIIDERKGFHRSWIRLYRKLAYSRSKKLMLFASRPSIFSLVALFIARNSSISICYGIGGALQRLSWRLSALVVVPGGHERKLVKRHGAKQVVTVRPYLKAAHNRKLLSETLNRPNDGVIFYNSSRRGTELFLRALAGTDFTALLPRKFLRNREVSSLVTGLGIKHRVMPLPTNLLAEACQIADAAVVSFAEATYPRVFFSPAADKLGWLVSQQSAALNVFNSTVIDFDETSVQSLTEAMLKFNRERKHLKQTVFVGPEEEGEAIESLQVLFNHVS